MVQKKDFPILDFDNGDNEKHKNYEKKLWNGCVSVCKKLIDIQQNPANKNIKVFIEDDTEHFIELYSIVIDYNKIVCYMGYNQLSNGINLSTACTILDCETICWLMTKFPKKEMLQDAIEYFKKTFIVLDCEQRINF